LVCYGVMSLLCYLKGKKTFPIPYNFKPLFGYLIIAILIIYGVDLIKMDTKWLSYGVKLLITAVFTGTMFFFEGRKINYKSS